MTDDDKPFAAMKLVCSGQQIDLLTGWQFVSEPADDPLLHLLLQGFYAKATQVLRTVFADNPPSASLPILWSLRGDEPHDGSGGAPVTDPCMIYFNLPLGGVDGVDYSIPLECIIDDLIESLANMELVDADGVAHGVTDDADGILILNKVAARLRELADKLDKACNPDEAPT